VKAGLWVCRVLVPAFVGRHLRRVLSHERDHGVRGDRRNRVSVATPRAAGDEFVPLGMRRGAGRFPGPLPAGTQSLLGPSCGQ
jgi:hypothetical protein